MKRTITTLAMLTVLCLTTTAAVAGPYGYSGGNGYGNSYGRGFGGYQGPSYRAPAVHFDRVYHPTTSHWTPSRGYHTHGHYDSVPHFTPRYNGGGYGNHNHINHGHHH